MKGVTVMSMKEGEEMDEMRRGYGGDLILRGNQPV